MELVLFPGFGIVQDISTNPRHCGLVTNDMVVKSALPDGNPRGLA